MENNYFHNNKKQVKWNNEFAFHFMEEKDILVEKNNSFHIKEHNRKDHVNIDDDGKNNHIRIKNINCVIPKKHGVVQEPFHWIFQYQWNASNKCHKKEVFPAIQNDNNNDNNDQYIFVDLLKNKKWLSNKNKLEIEMLYMQ